MTNAAGEPFLLVIGHWSLGFAHFFSHWSLGFGHSSVRSFCRRFAVDPLEQAAEYAAGKIPGARMRWFPDVGHMPFAERVEEFNADLGAFAGSVTSH